MWTHEIWREANQSRIELQLGKYPDTIEEHGRLVAECAIDTVQLPTCPLMHGTGLFTAIGAILGGGTVVTMAGGAKFDPVAIWETVDQRRVTNMAIVGDAFAKPLLQVLEEDPGKYDLSCVRVILSSGVMWSVDVKRGLLRHIPQAALMDSFGASESIGFGMSVMTAEGEFQTAQFLSLINI